jgi:iron(III) transport system permease protein
MWKEKIKLDINLWSILSFIFVILIILPNIDIILHLFNKPNENWLHIKTYLLKDYIINSIKLITATSLLTLIIGTVLAWLISIYEFPMRRFFKWALVLPLAFPPYIAAYTYNGIFNYTGVVQRFLRNVLNLELNPKYFDIMSINGAIFIFTAFLFPYVYMITRSFLEKQSSSLLENARLLGRNSFEIFAFILLPISRGAIVSGTTLVILEVLNDYGVVSYFGIPTFSTAIFSTWFSMGDIDSAVKLSSLLMFIVFGVILLERWLRGRRKYSYTNTKVRPVIRQQLKGVKASLATAFCFIILSIGFIIPTLQLAYWSLLTYEKILNMKFFILVLNSMGTAVIASILIIFISIIIANFCRMQDNWISKIFSKITLLGYSIPAAVIAIGVILFFVDLDRNLYWLYKIINPNTQTLVLSTSISMLLFAYVIRFMAVGYQSIESGFDKVGKKFFEASRLLGRNVSQTFWEVDFPMIKPAIISGLALTFIDIIKELPLTLILRPFNFHTLATKTFEYANDEMIHEASIASLIIILISVFSIYMIFKMGEKEKV